MRSFKQERQSMMLRQHTGLCLRNGYSALASCGPGRGCHAFSRHYDGLKLSVLTPDHCLIEYMHPLRPQPCGSAAKHPHQLEQTRRLKESSFSTFLDLQSAQSDGPISQDTEYIGSVVSVILAFWGSRFALRRDLPCLQVA